MNKPEAERAVVERLDGVYEIVLIPYHYPPYETLVTAEGVQAELRKVSSRNVLYYSEVEQNEGSRRGLFC